MAHALNWVQPGLAFFEKKNLDRTFAFGPLVNAFKAACLFHQGRVTDMHPDATTVIS